MSNNNNIQSDYNSQTFASNIDIDNFFKKFGSNGFSEWFNSNISSTSPWKTSENNTDMSYTIDKANWESIWNNIPIIFGRNSINLVEFLCINSIMINETGGSFKPVSESVNSFSKKNLDKGTPGIAYEFNAGGKSSYNTLAGNKTAYQCFRDSYYISAHGTKPMSDILKNTTDSRWSGTVFPIGFSGLEISDETSGNGIKNGFLIEADFFKFRGRGFIQTTSRPNYKPLIKYVLDYTGNDQPISEVKKEWSKYNGNLDVIATISTNAQWDKLFQQKNFIVANYAVYIHSNQNSKYSTIEPNQSPLNLQKSIINVGAKIAGGGPNTNYAKLFLQRVQIQLDIINKNASPSITPLASNDPTPTEEPGRLENTGQDPNSQVSGNNVTGTLASISNLFKPTAKPGSISFNI